MTTAPAHGRRAGVRWVCALTVLLFAPLQAYPDAPVLRVGDFSSGWKDTPLPPEWEEHVFGKIERHTRYRVAKDEDGMRVLRADSRAAASGLIRRIRVDPEKYPILRWRWKVSNVYEKGDAKRKAGDDYPARVYLLFAYDPQRATWAERLQYEAAKVATGSYPPWCALNYIWASRMPVDSVTVNRYSERSVMIAVRTGDNQANAWQEETRNVREDYRRAFGEEIPEIVGIAIMTDSDNTGESATSWYGDIHFISDLPLD